MSGTRQHFIPKFMMRGFLDRTKAKREIVHVYRKNLPSFTTDIKNIGLESGFYGEAGDESLDDRITELENEFSNQIANLRSYSRDQIVDKETSAALCAHLATRTRHFRLIASQIINETVEKISKRYQDPKNKEAIIKRLFEGDQARLRTLLIGELAKHPQSKALTLEQQELLVEQLLSKPKDTMDIFVQGLTKQIGLLLTALRLQTDGIIKNGHNKSLHIDDAVAEHVKKFRNFDWIVCLISHELILGDFMLLIETAGTPRFASYIAAIEAPTKIYLPIANNKVLIGYQEGCSQLYIEPQMLNRLIAANSVEYFIGPSNSSDLQQLSNHIGDGIKDLNVVYEKMIDELIDTQLLGK